jgi:hypothetical protein
VSDIEGTVGLGAPGDAQPNQTANPGTPEGNPAKKRRQLSGAEKRKRARLKAAIAARPIAGQEGTGTAVVVMPRVPSETELQSLTGTARELARCYREWRMGHLRHGDYLVAVRGLAALKDGLTALEAERQTALAELIQRQLQHMGQPLESLPAPSRAREMPQWAKDATEDET